MSDKQSGKPGGAVIRRILVPLDGSDFGEAALPYAEQLAAATGAEVILLQSIAPHPLEIDLAETRSPHLSKLRQEYLDHSKAAARDYLAAIQKRLSEKGITARYLVEIGPPADRIVACAKEREVDLIALSTHGRSGIGALVMGSVANKVFHVAEVPVLLVKPRKQTTLS
ncbi:MAG: universal stress protein [Dehalococcoidia bacterium]|nr:universal stress protein [Dehalococcoidia bacterium]